MVTVGVAAGAEPFASEAIACIRSLHQNTSVDRIVVYIPESERAEIGPNKRDTLDRLARVEYGPTPIEGYPISTKLAGFVRTTAYDDDWYLLLDTDTLVVNPLKPLLDTTAQLRAKPIDVATSPWETDNEPAWRALYQGAGKTYPGRTMTSTVDNRSVPPLYNAGVVMTRDRSLPQRWLSLTKDIAEAYPEEFFADQLALGMISTEYAVDPLPSTANFPLPWHLRTPSQTVILHYHNPEALLRVLHPEIRRRINRTGLLSSEVVPRVPTGLVLGMVNYVRRHVGLRLRQ